MSLRAELMALNTPGNNDLHRAALAGNGLARVYAQVVQQLLDDAGLAAGAIAAIGQIRQHAVDAVQRSARHQADEEFSHGAVRRG